MIRTKAPISAAALNVPRPIHLAIVSALPLTIDERYEPWVRFAAVISMASDATSFSRTPNAAPRDGAALARRAGLIPVACEDLNLHHILMPASAEGKYADRGTSRPR